MAFIILRVKRNKYFTFINQNCKLKKYHNTPFDQIVKYRALGGAIFFYHVLKYKHDR